MMSWMLPPFPRFPRPHPLFCRHRLLSNLLGPCVQTVLAPLPQRVGQFAGSPFSVDLSGDFLGVDSGDSVSR